MWDTGGLVNLGDALSGLETDGKVSLGTFM